MLKSLALLLFPVAILALAACGGDNAAAPKVVAFKTPPAAQASGTPDATKATVTQAAPTAATTAASTTASTSQASPTATQRPAATAATQPPQATPTPTAAQSSSPSSAAVTAHTLSFSPTSVTIAAGGTVTWTWDDSTDSIVHNVRGDGFRSGDPAEKGRFSFTFMTPGTYAFFCEVHQASGMRGTVVVQ